MDTLYQKVFRIERSREYASQEQRDTAIRAEFEQWRKISTVVDAVLDGKTTFSAEHQTLYAGINATDFFIPYLIPQNNMEGFRELEICLGRTGNMIKPGGFEALVLNPLTCGLGGIAAVARGVMNRREFLAKIKYIATGAGIGLAVGAVFPFLSLADAVNMGENAMYLDKTRTRVYRIS